MPLQAKTSGSLLGRLRQAQRAPPAAGRRSCPSDMVEVEGDYCPYVEEKCVRWLDPATKLQCAEFETRDRARCFMKTEHKHFCMDRFEWPNKLGAAARSPWPAGAKPRPPASRAASASARDTEWTLACEGPEHHPYPYGTGYTRDDSACNVDKPYVWPQPGARLRPAAPARTSSRVSTSASRRVRAARASAPTACTT